MKVFFILFLVVFTFFQTYAQQEKNRSLVIVPFDNKMFNNEEAEQMCKASNMTYEQSVQYFKSSLDASITTALKDSCTLYSLLRTYTTDAQSDIDIVHQQAVYVMTERPTNGEEKKALNAIDMPKIGKKKKSKSQTQDPGNGEVVSVREDNSNKFVSAKFPDPQLFIDLVNNYSAQYVVFITQFEIIGDYSDPYAVGLGTYPRIIKVHFVIFNEKGKFLKGDFVTTTFTEKEYNIPTICNTYLPEIAKQIARKIP